MEVGHYCGVRTLVILAISAAAAYVSAAPADEAQRAAMLARDKALELPTAYVPPPGNPLEHHAAGFAQIMCSAVFITGLDPDFAAENVGYFTAPYAERAKLGKPVVDRAAKTVSVAVPGGAVRIAKYVGDQGCVTFPVGKNELEFKPQSDQIDASRSRGSALADGRQAIRRPPAARGPPQGRIKPWTRPSPRPPA